MALNKRFFSFLTAAAAFAAFAVVAPAQDTAPAKPEKTDKIEKRAGFKGPAFGRGMHRGMRAGKLARHFGRGVMFRGITLTDAQKEQIKKIREANQPDKALLEELRTIRQSRKAGTDLTAEQKARVAAIHDQLRTKAQTVHDQIQNILTAEQKAQIEQRKTEMKQRMEQFRQRRDQMRKQRDLNRPGKTDTPPKKDG
jgi:Spy/CpxP family protein refolding chaperone